MPGNPDAIGAHITTRYSDGSAQAIELATGSGYLSQSEALALFAVPTNQVVTTLEVIWPNGDRTTHTLPHDARRLELHAPTHTATIAQR
ncbi:MAG: ASPIC/UnbV domain-containing protein [Candidatus Synoicihabitans palmerolidicus]|nr:ASPIC/UnbV domain-containing protein [Candidatus Synoicihabitans palmerolidicus]